MRDRWEDQRRDPVHGAGSTLAGTHDVVRFGWRPWEDAGNGGDASPAASPPTPPETSGSPESPRPPTPESPLPAFTDALPITPEVTPRRSRLSARLTHAVVLAVTVAVVAGGGFWNRAPVPSQPGGSDVMRYASVASAGGPDFSIPAFGGVGLSGYLSAAGVSVTVPQLEVATYVTVEGQTVADVARETGRTVETLLAANNLMDAESELPAGTSLRVPPTDGILHTVVEGDTVESLAATYGVEPSAIRDYLPNGLSAGAPLVVGRDVMIPGGTRPEPLPIPSRVAVAPHGPTPIEPGTPAPEAPEVGVATGSFIWPTEGIITQYFHEGHSGWDIANQIYTPLYAADGGVVTFAGWNDYGLGYAVSIDHGNGFVTWYGHLAEEPAVSVGQPVAQGDYIGPMGSTGYSTGPHLHFIIELDGVYQDPALYLH